jgi:hypothetical protein
MVSGAFALIAATAKDPSSRFSVSTNASRKGSPAATLCANRCAMTSVSVSERNS